MHRRLVLKGGAAAFVSATALAGASRTVAADPAIGRSLEIRVRIDLAPSKAGARVWIPVPGLSYDGRVRLNGTSIEGDADRAELLREPVAMVAAEWRAGAAAPRLEVVSRVSILGRPGVHALSEEDRARHLQPTSFCSSCDAERHANLARAVGTPARVVCGLRIPMSRLPGDGMIVQVAQHRHAEVWLDEDGWIPVDADARPSSEAGWVAFNDAPSVALPGALVATPGFFGRPRLETAAGFADRPDSERFGYAITAREVPNEPAGGSRWLAGLPSEVTKSCPARKRA